MEEKIIMITVVPPVECTEEQFRLWVEFCLGYRADISLDNPLNEYDLEANFIEFN